MSFPWHQQAHRIFIWILVVQWLAGLCIGYAQDSFFMSLILGSFIAVLPILLILKAPNLVATRHVIAIATQLLTALHIQQMMGLTEVHFEIFTLLALLSIYRDWKVIVSAVATIAVHHIVFYFMQSSGAGVYIFEASHVMFSILVVHAFFAILEGGVLMYVAYGLEKESLTNLALSSSVENIIQDDKIVVNERAKGNSESIISFNGLLDSLNALIFTVKSSGTTANNLSTDIAESSANTLKGLKSNADEVSHITLALKQISEANADVAKNVEGISNLSTEVTTETSGAKNIIDSSSEKAEKLKIDMDLAASSIQALADMVGTIEDSMASIKSISDQTNLLALNAAIESARAGEHGRGFAVVADEVRKLATKTGENAEEISNITEQLSIGAEKAVSVITSCSEKVLETVESSKIASNKVSDINVLIDKLNQNISTVATTAEEHSATSNSIALSAKNLHESTHTQVEILQLNQTNLQNLDDQIKILNSELTKFEV